MPGPAPASTPMQMPLLYFDLHRLVQVCSDAILLCVCVVWVYVCLLCYVVLCCVMFVCLLAWLFVCLFDCFFVCLLVSLIALLMCMLS